MVLGNSCGSTILSSKAVTIHRLRTTVLETGNWNSVKVSSLARKTRGAVTSLGLELRVWSHSHTAQLLVFLSIEAKTNKSQSRLWQDRLVPCVKCKWCYPVHISLAIILYLECFVMLKYPKEFSFVLAFKWEGLINWRTPVVKDIQLSRTLSAEALL